MGAFRGAGAVSSSSDGWSRSLRSCGHAGRSYFCPTVAGSIHCIASLAGRLVALYGSSASSFCPLRWADSATWVVCTVQDKVDTREAPTGSAARISTADSFCSHVPRCWLPYGLLPLSLKVFLRRRTPPSRLPLLRLPIRLLRAPLPGLFGTGEGGGGLGICPLSSAVLTPAGERVQELRDELVFLRVFVQLLVRATSVEGVDLASSATRPAQESVEFAA